MHVTFLVTHPIIHVATVLIKMKKHANVVALVNV